MNADTLNYVEIGGEYGRKRRLPGYVIIHDPSKATAYKAVREDNGEWAGMAPTLEGLERMMRPYSDRWLGLI